MKKRFGLAMILLLMMMAVCALGEVAIDETNFPDIKFRLFVSYTFDRNNDHILSDDEIAAATKMDCQKKNITSMKGLEYFTALEELDCHKNKLESLEVGNNTALIKINCSDNQLNSINVSSLSKLEKLYAASNPFTSLDVTHNPRLTELGLSSVLFSSVDLSKNTELYSLSISNCSLSGIDVTHNSKLNSFYLDNCNLKTIDIRQNTALEWFGCDNNQLTTVDTSKNTSLISISCKNNQISKLNLQKNAALLHIICMNNKLSTLDISHNPKLVTVYCYGNKLSFLNVTKCPNLVKLITENQRQTQSLYDYWNHSPYAVYVDPGLPVISKTEFDVEYNGCKYHIKNNTAALTGVKNTDIKKLTIPASVTSEGIQYKVTAISAKACEGLKKLTTLIIGKNVKDIGKGAFQNCSKLKSITVKTTLLTTSSVKGKVFKGINKKAIFKCPKKKLDAYQKLFIKAGAPKTCTFK